MGAFWKKSLAVTFVALVLSLIAATPAFSLKAFAPQYSYTNNTYSTIKDGNGFEFSGAGYACSFSGSAGEPTNIASGPNDTCSDGDNPNYYWVHKDNDGTYVLVASGGEENPKGSSIVAYRSFLEGESEPFDSADSVSVANARTDSPQLGLTYNPPYRYDDDSYNVVVDADSVRYDSVGYGCQIGSDGTITQQAQPKTTTNYSFDSPQCGSGSNAQPANHYWVATQGSKVGVLAVLGSTAEELGRPAKNNITDATFRLYDNGQAITTVNTVEMSRLTSDDVNTLSDRCRQDIGVLSWILCPVVEFITDKVVDPLQNIILELLSTDPLITAPTDADNTSFWLYNAWKVFLQIANVLLVLVFIILIFMQLFAQDTFIGFHRAIPRLVVAAIAMQFSYYIAALIIDVGNVLATGIAGLFEVINKETLQNAIDSGAIRGHEFINPLSGSSTNVNQSDLLRGLGGLFGVLIVVVSSFVATFGFFGVVIFYLAGFALSVFAAFLALALRQLLIAVMVVIAPIAFIMSVFPATNKWMREWFDNLIKLVLIYPLIALLFAVGGTMSLIALGTEPRDFNYIVSAAMPLIVLALIPVLLRYAGGIFRTLTGGIQNLSAKAKQGAQGDPRDPLSWASNVKYGKAERKLELTSKLGKRYPFIQARTRPSWQEAHVGKMAEERMSGVMSAMFPGKIRRLIWGGQSFQGFTGVGNWSQADIMAQRPFARGESRYIYRSPLMFLNTAQIAAQDTGMHPDKAMNYLWGIGNLRRQGTVSEDAATPWYDAYVKQIKGSHMPADTLSLDYVTKHGWENPSQLAQTTYMDSLNSIANPQLQDDVFGVRRGYVSKAAGNFDDRQSGTSFQTLSGVLEDDATVERLMSENGDEAQQWIEDIRMKAQSMNMELRKRYSSAEIQRMADDGGDEEVAQVGGYGRSGYDIRQMQRFISAAEQAYQQATRHR